MSDFGTKERLRQSSKEVRAFEGLINSTSGQTGGEISGIQGGVLSEYIKSVRVRAENGLFDHIELKANHGYVVGSNEEIDLFRRFLGSAPKNCRDSSEANLFGRTFNVSSFNGAGDYALKVRRTKSVYGKDSQPVPLFSGRLYTKRERKGDNHVQCNIRTDLHLNPTRAMNLAPDILSSDKERLAEAFIKQRCLDGCERGLDGNDNIIPLERLSATREGGMSIYLNAVYGLINYELIRASSAIDGLPMQGSVIGVNEIAIKGLETYWEFQSDDALALIAKLKPLLRTYHQQNRERTHGHDDIRFGNAQTITMHLSSGEMLRVYAKTINRIRFEVVHKPRKQKGLVSGGYTAPNMDQLQNKMSELREKAAKRINHLLEFLEEWGEETPQQRAASLDYMALWFQEMGYLSSSRQLLGLLKENGCVIAGKYLPQSFLSVLRKARSKRLGLIYYCDKAKAYYPSPIRIESGLAQETLTSDDKLEHITGTQDRMLRSQDPLNIRDCEIGVRIPPPPPIYLARVCGLFCLLVYGSPPKLV